MFYSKQPSFVMPPSRSVSLSRGLLLGAASESGTALAGPLAELSAQNMAPPQRFVAVTTAGVLELEKLRPVDVLAQVRVGVTRACHKYSLVSSLAQFQVGI